MPTLDLAIRPYRADDLVATVDLWYRSWCATFPDIQHPLPRDQWETRFTEEIAVNNTVWIAARAPRIVGFLAVDPGSGYLDQIFVDPANHGRGVGGALMAKAKALCPTGIRLHTLQQNAAALRFYEAHGFRIAGTGISPHNKLPTIECIWTP